MLIILAVHGYPFRGLINLVSSFMSYSGLLLVWMGEAKPICGFVDR